VLKKKRRFGEIAGELERMRNALALPNKAGCVTQRDDSRPRVELELASRRFAPWRSAQRFRTTGIGAAAERD